MEYVYSVNLEILRATVFLLFTLIVGNSFSQREAAISGGITANSTGFGLVFNHLNEANRNGISVRDIKVELTNLYNQKEIFIMNNRIPSVNAYKFGKVNHALVWRGSWGMRKVVAVRQERKAMGMNVFTRTGPSLAYYFPIYIYRYPESATSPYDSIVAERYNPDVHPQEIIAGKAPFTRGLFQGGIVPGWHIEAGFDFLWGNYQSDHKQLTAGVRLEMFSKKVPLLHRSEWNRSLYTSFYITFALGTTK